MLAAAAVLAEADGVISKGTLGSELCDAIRSVAVGQLRLPMISQPLAAMIGRWLDPEEQAIFAMRLAGITRGDIATRFGVSGASLESRLGEMLRKLETLDVAPTAFRSGRQSGGDWALAARRAAA